MIRKLIRLYQWLPVIWKDEEWDYNYLLDIIKYKLSRMEKVIGSPRSFAAHWEQRRVELAQAQLLISKFHDDPDDEWTAHYNQYHTGEGLSCPAETTCRLSLSASHKRTERNWKAIWKHFEKCGRGWWD